MYIKKQTNKMYYLKRPLKSLKNKSLLLITIIIKAMHFHYMIFVEQNFVEVNHPTMCDFHNFGLIFTGQCTVCLKG